MIFSIQRSCDNKMLLSNRFSPENMCYFFLRGQFFLSLLMKYFSIISRFFCSLNLEQTLQSTWGLIMVWLKKGNCANEKKNKTLNWLLKFCCFSKNQIRFKSWLQVDVTENLKLSQLKVNCQQANDLMKMLNFVLNF